MQFQWIGVSNRVEAEHKVDVGQEIAGGVHVEVLLQPPLGASVVDLAAAGEKEGDGVGRVGPRGGVEGGQQSSNLWSVDFFTKSKRQEETIIEICSNRERPMRFTSRSMDTPDPLLLAPVERLKF